MNLHSSVIRRFNYLKLYNKLVDNVYIPILFVFLLMGLSRSTLLVKGLFFNVNFMKKKI